MDNTPYLHSSIRNAKDYYQKKCLLLFLTMLFINFTYAEESMTQNEIKSLKNEGAQFIQLDNGFRVWTKRIGEGPIKILTLHGGPVILSNITGSVDSYVTYINHLRSNFPQSIQDRLSYYEDKEDYLNPEYEKLMFEEVYSRYVCRLKPWPESLLRTFSHLNTKVYTERDSKVGISSASKPRG